MTLNKFVPGLLTKPRLGFKRLSFTASSGIVPPRHDARDELLVTSDQGRSSECTSYALTGIIEAAKWREDWVYEQINPHELYVEQKRIDGMPGDGSTLEAAVQAAQNLGMISSVDAGSIRAIYSPAEVHRAFHRYRLLLMAFNITEGWMHPKSTGQIQDGGKALGGHAVIGCTYEAQGRPGMPQHYGIQNSWTEDWGLGGFGWLTPEQFEREFMFALVWDYRR